MSYEPESTVEASSINCPLESRYTVVEPAKTAGANVSRITTNVESSLIFRLTAVAVNRIEIVPPWLTQVKLLESFGQRIDG